MYFCPSVRPTIGLFDGPLRGGGGCVGDGWLGDRVGARGPGILYHGEADCGPPDPPLNGFAKEPPGDFRFFPKNKLF